MRERGLKFCPVSIALEELESLSLRERGLKFYESPHDRNDDRSLSLRERGLKYLGIQTIIDNILVALLARAWIEITATDKARKKRMCRSPCESVD